MLEKKTQHYLAIRIPGKTSEAVNAAMQKLREEFGESFFSQIFKTITVDNGPEFADFAQTEQFGTKVYFAHPYTSWERAQNERENGMLRRYIPKGSPLRTSQMRRFSGPRTRSTAYPAGIWDTARRRSCLRLSWIPSTQPERLRKPQFWLNLTLQPKLGLILGPLSTRGCPTSTCNLRCKFTEISQPMQYTVPLLRLYQ